MPISPYTVHPDDFMNLDALPTASWDRYCENIRTAALAAATPPNPTAGFTSAHIGTAADFISAGAEMPVAVPAESGPAIVQDTIYDAAFDMVRFVPRMLTGVVPIKDVRGDSVQYAGWESGDMTVGVDDYPEGLCGHGCIICKDALQNVMDTPWGVDPASVFPDAECDCGGVVFGLAGNSYGSGNYGVKSVIVDTSNSLLTVLFARELATPPVVTVTSGIVGTTLLISNVTTSYCVARAVISGTNDPAPISVDSPFGVLYCGVVKL